MAELDPAIVHILSRYFASELSAPVTVMQLLIETEDADAVRGIVTAAARDSKFVDARGDAVQRATDLEQVMISNADGCARIAAMLRADVDSPKPATTVEEGIAFSERLFDWSVQQSEEASVALYSLGNPSLLERATAEVVSQLREWGAITPDAAVLDVGCGIGRLLIALAPEVRSITGIDVSAEMVKAARRRCAQYQNVTVIKGDGRGLSPLADSSFDVVLAVDSFPYIRQSGYALAELFFSESARVLKPGGQLVILNYSYSEDDDADATEVRDLAARNEMRVLEAGTRRFRMWDGIAFRMTKDGKPEPAAGARVAGS
jgi:cyclopropane fatty-acyl-phospholipid synthase-like methyltransferase